jgi:hypothetical protein
MRTLRVCPLRDVVMWSWAGSIRSRADPWCGLEALFLGCRARRRPFVPSLDCWSCGAVGTCLHIRDPLPQTAPVDCLVLL